MKKPRVGLLATAVDLVTFKQFNVDAGDITLTAKPQAIKIGALALPEGIADFLQDYAGLVVLDSMAVSLFPYADIVTLNRL